MKEYYLPKESGEFYLEAEVYQRKALVARVEDGKFPYDGLENLLNIIIALSRDIKRAQITDYGRFTVKMAEKAGF